MFRKFSAKLIYIISKIIARRMCILFSNIYIINGRFMELQVGLVAFLFYNISITAMPSNLEKMCSGLEREQTGGS